ncbi:MAG: right-handed parallel beta-helix repeat-containing protein [Reichenbachiella sp.]
MKNQPTKNLTVQLLSACFLSSLIFLISCDQDNSSVTPTIPEIEVPEIQTIDLDCEACKYVIELTDGEFDGSAHTDVGLGDTVGIRGGNRQGLHIVNVNVDLVASREQKENTVFINCSGKVIIVPVNPNFGGLHIEKSKYFTISGAGITEKEDGQDKVYGMKIEGYQALEIAYLSTNFEVLGIHIPSAGYAGIVARSDATCDGLVNKDTHTQYNTILHDNLVENTGGEGFYVGGSHWANGQEYQPGCVGTLLFEPELKGVRVYNNIVKTTGRDGIQVGSAVEDSEIFNNYIENYSHKKEDGHMSGIQINPGTTGKLYNNIILNGEGFGIFMGGRGDNFIYNNIIVAPTYDGIITQDNKSNGDFYFINNTIVSPSNKGLTNYSTNTSYFYNNIIAAPDDKYFEGKELIQEGNLLVTSVEEVLFNHDYSLKEGSPAIDGGKNVKEFNIVTDIAGNERPQGDAYDIGAFESSK